MATVELKCGKCGGELKVSGRLYECAYCHAKYESDNVEKEKAALASILDEQKQEQLAHRRHMLWEEIHAEYVDSDAIVALCRSLRKLLPDDFSARFFEVANSGTEKQVNEFLRSVDTADTAQAFWAEEIIRFMLKSLRAGNLLAVQSLIERAYKNTDLEKYEEYSTAFSAEAKRVKGGVYEPNEPRDVFVMYSGRDMKAVEELVECLEERGMTCFVAMRNLQHGRGAVANYQNSIEKAMNACKTVAFVSSKFSRSFSCDAVRIELPYLMKNGQNKPRVEYCLDSDGGGSGLVKEYFAGLERVYSKDEAANRIEQGLAALSVGDVGRKTQSAQEKICVNCGTKNPVKNKFCAECGGREFVESEEAYENLKLDQEKSARAAAEKKAAEAEREKQALIEELNRLKAERQAAQKAREEAAKKQAEEEKKKAEETARKQEKQPNTPPMVETNGNISVKPSIKQEEKKPIKTAEEWYQEGLAYHNSQRTDQAAQAYEQAAKQGHSGAQRNLACLYYGKEEFSKAFPWFVKAAEQGEAGNQNNLGICYYYGKGTPQDFKKAAEWYEKAAVQGDAPAQYNLAGCYKDGNGVRKDLKKAVEWYEKAAAQGHADAKKALADCQTTLAEIEKLEAIGKEAAKKAAEEAKKQAEEKAKKQAEKQAAKQKATEAEFVKKGDLHMESLWCSYNRKEMDRSEREALACYDKGGEVGAQKAAMLRAKIKARSVCKEGGYVREGDTVWFGWYPQDGVLFKPKKNQIVFEKKLGYYRITEGDDAGEIVYSDSPMSEEKGFFYVEPIRWRIVEEKDGEAWLIADEILDCRRFDDKNNNYARSEIRKWLNGEFLNKAFPKEARKKLVAKKVDNSAATTGKEQNKNACADTRDEVFLPSYQDLTKRSELYMHYFNHVKTTSYVRGKFLATKIWTRSPHDISYNSVKINALFSNGIVTDETIGVVPMVWMKL